MYVRESFSICVYIHICTHICTQDIRNKYCLVVCEVSVKLRWLISISVFHKFSHNSPMENNETFKQAYFGLRPARSVKVEGIEFDPRWTCYPREGRNRNKSSVLNIYILLSKGYKIIQGSDQHSRKCSSFCSFEEDFTNALFFFFPFFGTPGPKQILKWGHF